MFPLGNKQTEPVITFLKGQGFIVGRDNMSIFIDQEGNPLKNHPVKWSDIPVSVGKLETLNLFTSKGTVDYSDSLYCTVGYF